jgi:ribonuclease D
VVTTLAADSKLPVENLLSPDLVRRLMWSPPEPRDPEAVAETLRAGGAREWQVELTRDLLVEAITSPPAPPVAPLPDADDEDLVEE